MRSLAPRSLCRGISPSGSAPGPPKTPPPCLALSQDTRQGSEHPVLSPLFLCLPSPPLALSRSPRPSATEPACQGLQHQVPAGWAGSTRSLHVAAAPSAGRIPQPRGTHRSGGVHHRQVVPVEEGGAEGAHEGGHEEQAGPVLGRKRTARQIWQSGTQLGAHRTYPGCPLVWGGCRRCVACRGQPAQAGVLGEFCPRRHGARLASDGCNRQALADLTPLAGAAQAATHYYVS